MIAYHLINITVQDVLKVDISLDKQIGLIMYWIRKLHDNKVLI
jgi:hypothetical protein